jgi:hypothetical protein
MPIRIVEIHVHRSKKHKKFGYAVALLFPCNHHKYLGITLYKGDKDTHHYMTQDCKIIKFEDFSVMEREVCKLCPPDEIWLDDLFPASTMNEFVEVLEDIEEL